MKHYLMAAAVATVGTAFIPQDAFAFHRHHGRCCTSQPACCSPAPNCATAPSGCAPSPATTTPVPDPAAAPAPQANNSNGYQSFSYEPGADVPPAPTPAFVGAPAIQQSFPTLYSRVRSDRKALNY